jgi:hypothetical protein
VFRDPKTLDRTLRYFYPPLSTPSSLYVSVFSTTVTCDISILLIILLRLSAVRSFSLCSSRVHLSVNVYIDCVKFLHNRVTRQIKCVFDSTVSWYNHVHVVYGCDFNWKSRYTAFSWWGTKKYRIDVLWILCVFDVSESRCLRSVLLLLLFGNGVNTYHSAYHIMCKRVFVHVLF